jgi:hypothetical protein
MNAHADSTARSWPFTIGNGGQIMTLLGNV